MCTEQHSLGLQLQLMERPYIRLPETLVGLQFCVRNCATTEARIQFLSGYCRSGDGNIDTDCARRTHGVSGIAYQQQSIACLIVY